MKKYLTKDDLINFEEKVAQEFNKGNIRAPIHLYYGNEEQIINVFKNVKKQDWVFCSWRSHYQCLLKGVPEDILMNEIVNENQYLYVFLSIKYILQRSLEVQSQLH